MNGRTYTLGLSLILLSTFDALAQIEGESDSTAPRAGADAGQEGVPTHDEDVAQAALPAATVVYDAPEQCPDRAAFVEMVLARNPQLDLNGEKRSRWALVRISRSDIGFSGSFLLKGDPSSTRAREVESPSCQEVVNALSVVTAIALDPAIDPSLAAPLSPHQSEPKKDEPPSSQEGSPEVSSSKKGESPVAGSFKIFPSRDEDILNTERSVAQRPGWTRGARLQHSTQLEDGELSLRRSFAVDSQAGAVLGLFPNKAVPRIDVNVRTSLLMKAPQDKAFLVGFMPRVRVSTMPTARYNLGEIQNTIWYSYVVSLGGCYSPYFNPKGFAVLLCADYGGGVMNQDPASRGDVEIPADTPQEGRVDVRGVAKIAATVDAEYNLFSIFHLAARVGFESHLTGLLDLYDAPDRLFYRRGRALGFATAGVGVHF